MSNLALKTIEELDCALLESAKYLADMDRLGDAWQMYLHLGNNLDLVLPTPIARELISKRQAEINAELERRRKLLASRPAECTCACTCGAGDKPQGSLV